jgi:hypothetical protein
MSKVSKRTFSLPAEQAAYIDVKVENGAYERRGGAGLRRDEGEPQTRAFRQIGLWLVQRLTRRQSPSAFAR